jgi:hypothetical protein
MVAVDDRSSAVLRELTFAFVELVPVDRSGATL